MSGSTERLDALIRRLEFSRRLLLDPATSIPYPGCEARVAAADDLLDVAWEFREIVRPRPAADWTLAELQAAAARMREEVRQAEGGGQESPK